MIDLSRPPGRPLVVGHRGAAAIAPENTIEGFRAAAALGVDVIEFDVLPLPAGPIVVAHSLSEVAPALPTFAEALTWFADEATHVGLHVDFKGSERIDEAAALLIEHDVDDRTVLSSVSPDVLRAAGRVSSRVQLALTYPDDRLGISKRPFMRPLVPVALEALRVTLPLRLPALLRRAEAGALMLQHRVVSRAAVARSHALGVPVLAWTVDDPADVERMIDAGVDGVITNDPRILLATLAP
ncbi:MAG: glycerophosphodiester phosphodiesterase [Actinobacteria bacterium]|nr:MAG: glycerophosphodiester phosphodiesterase [Actinomycetota bacterium]